MSDNEKQKQVSAVSARLENIENKADVIHAEITTLNTLMRELISRQNDIDSSTRVLADSVLSSQRENSTPKARASGSARAGSAAKSASDSAGAKTKSKSSAIPLVKEREEQWKSAKLWVSHQIVSFEAGEIKDKRFSRKTLTKYLDNDIQEKINNVGSNKRATGYTRDPSAWYGATISTEFFKKVPGADENGKPIKENKYPEAAEYEELFEAALKANYEPTAEADTEDTVDEDLDVDDSSASSSSSAGSKSSKKSNKSNKSSKSPRATEDDADGSDEDPDDSEGSEDAENSDDAEAPDDDEEELEELEELAKPAKRAPAKAVPKSAAKKSPPKAGTVKTAKVTKVAKAGAAKAGTSKTSAKRITPKK